MEPESNTLALEDSDRPPGAVSGNPTADVEWTGRMLQTIRIVVASSRVGRAAQITEEEWQALPNDDKGDIVYFLRDGDFEEPVKDEATYLKLAEDRRGHLEYYRRERPRLAQMKVWGWGDEIGTQLVAGGGAIEATFSGNPNEYFDGNWASANQMPAIVPGKPDLNILTVDLGGILWMKEVRLATAQAPRGYVLRGSTGGLDAQGEKIWTVLSTPEHEVNIDNGFHRFVVDTFAPLRRIRFLELFFLAHVTDSSERATNFFPNIREILLYPGLAPPAEVVLESPPIDLEGLFNLGAVRWEAQTPPGSGVEIRTRTGNQLVEVTRYYDKAGNEMTGKDEESIIKNYNRLRSFKGPIIPSLEIGSGWSPWSQKYLVSGELATSPGLRSHLQIQARLVSDDHETIPVLERISIDLQQPLAHGLGAEVWPALTFPGRLDTFEVFVQPDFLQQPEISPGIDEIRLRSDPPIDLRLLDLAVGTEDELDSGQPLQLFDRWFVDDGNSMLLDAASPADTLRVMSQGDSLWVVLPQVLESTPASLLQRSYYRLVSPGDADNPPDEVPTDLSGELLTFYSHDVLSVEERGQVIYFRQVGEGDAFTDNDVVSVEEYEKLPDEEKGPIRYFRKVTSVGNQSAYDELGIRLVRQYPRRNERGWEIGPGRLVRLRFTSEVFLPTTVLDVAVRNSGLEATWQAAREQDVTGLRPAQTLVIRAPQPTGVIDDIAISPNPFTPNDDGVNELALIEFSLFRVFDERPVVLRIYTLGGHLVWQQEDKFLGGRQTMEWNGVNMNGQLVPPGLYVCQLEVLADADVSGLKQTRVIAVVY